jgi:hypothetical protein
VCRFHLGDGGSAGQPARESVNPFGASVGATSLNALRQEESIVCLPPSPCLPAPFRAPTLATRHTPHPHALRQQLALGARNTLQSVFLLRFGCVRGLSPVIKHLEESGALLAAQRYRVAVVLRCPDLLLRCAVRPYPPTLRPSCSRTSARPPSDSPPHLTWLLPARRWSWANMSVTAAWRTARTP